MKLNDSIPEVICVYKITNVVNGLILIGSTINLNKRINHYRNDIKKDNPLKHYNRQFLNDIIIYGINSFIVDIIEEFDSNITDVELKNKETDYILQYDSINPEIGYNIRIDRDGKYICNSSTRLLKKEQLKEQWALGIRDNHSEKLKNYWNDNDERKKEQSKVMTKALTKYLYTIYDTKGNVIYENISYKELVKKGYKCSLSAFNREEKRNKNPYHFISKVPFKNVIVERKRVNTI